MRIAFSRLWQATTACALRYVHVHVQAQGSHKDASPRITKQHLKHLYVYSQYFWLIFWLFPQPSRAFSILLLAASTHIPSHTPISHIVVNLFSNKHFACFAAAAPNMSVAQRGQRGLALLLLTLCISTVHCTIPDVDELVSTLRASLEQEDELSRSTATRSLLQNPDRPALNKYGGVNMTSE
jgi:hypothetical protein